MEVIDTQFIDDKGNVMDFMPSIVPIVTEDKKTKELIFIGTAFFITAKGLLVTAKHCFYHKDKLIDNLRVCYLVPGNMFLPIPITTFSLSIQYDVVYFQIQPLVNPEKGELVSFTPLRLTLNKPQIGDQLATFGFANSTIQYLENGESKKYFNSKSYLGKYIEYHEKGFSLLKNPCYQTNIKIAGGASGGPVFDKDGCVFAICSTGYDLHDESDEEISFVTPLSPTFIMDIETLSGKIVSVNDLIEANEICI